MAPDDALRPGIPSWLRCAIPTIPTSLASFCPDTPRPAAPPPAWFTHDHLCDAAGRVALAHAPRGAAECLELLEAGTTVRELNADRVVATGAGGVLHGLGEEEALRVVLFPSVEEARRRALLLLLLTWDCIVGALAHAQPRRVCSLLVRSPWVDLWFVAQTMSSCHG